MRSWLRTCLKCFGRLSYKIYVNGDKDGKRRTELRKVSTCAHSAVMPGTPSFLLSPHSPDIQKPAPSPVNRPLTEYVFPRKKKQSTIPLSVTANE